MEADGVFEVVDSGFDEYPGDGYRLRPVSPPPKVDVRYPLDTTVLYMLGFNTHELKVGDRIQISAKVVSRLVIERKNV